MTNFLSSVLFFPWEWKYLRTTVWDDMGRAYTDHELAGLCRKDVLDKLQAPTVEYVHQLASGENQVITARYYVSEVECGWRWFSWLPWPRLRQRFLDVSFSDAIIPQSDSWKGSMSIIGGRYTMQPGETAHTCIRRMEKNGI